MPLKTTPFDVAEHLPAIEDQNELIADALETGDLTFIRHTLNTVARARGMTQIARDAGVTREALYKALGPDGDPRMSTLLGVFSALGVKLSAAPDDEAPVPEGGFALGEHANSSGRLRVRTYSVDRQPVDHAVVVGSYKDPVNVKTDMDVIASDGIKVGTVDHLDGTKIKLSKDASPDGEHHYVPMDWIDHVDQRVHLRKSIEEVNADWHVSPN